MTAPTNPEQIPAPAWHDELASCLGPQCFPASHDDLAATLIRRHAPSHLLWRLAAAPRTRRFGSVEELLDHLEPGDSHPTEASAARRPDSW